MKFDHTEHQDKYFVYDLKVLGEMTKMSDDHRLEYFKESFPPKKEL